MVEMSTLFLGEVTCFSFCIRGGKTGGLAIGESSSLEIWKQLGEDCDLLRRLESVFMAVNDVVNDGVIRRTSLVTKIDPNVPI